MSALGATPLKQAEAATPVKPADRELVRWQRRLLPFMTAFIGTMACVFFIFSGLHLYQVTAFIENEHGQSIRGVIEGEIAKPTADKLTSDAVTQHALLLLEADTLDKRYHQANALLMSRIWSRQLAFITGMVMAFLGAVFILGKMSESASQISGGAAEWKVAITSASPGIILSCLGTVLLVASLYVRASLDVTDGPAYVNPLRSQVSTSSTTASAPANMDDSSRPLQLDDLQKLVPQSSGAPAKK